MKNLNKTQLFFIIMTLIAGVFYLLFKQNSMVQPSLNIPSTPSQNSELEKTSLKILKWETKNHIPVYFVSATELPMLDIAVTFRAGAAYSPDSPGVASLTNEMLVEGTTGYNTEQISEIFESIGAEYSSDVDRDSATVSLRSLTEPGKLSTALKLYTDILANPSFPSKSFARVKNNTLRGLTLAQQYPETLLNENFYRQVYIKHPYAIPVGGTLESVGNIKRGDLVTFFDQYYVTGNAMIAMVGNLDMVQAKRLAENVSKAIKPGKKAAKLPDAAKLTDNIKQHIDFPASQTHILVGSVGIKRDDPDYYALKVGNHILGSMPLSSLLFKNVRINKGLAYSVYSSFIPMQDRGPFIINMQTRNEMAQEALKTTLKTLTKFVENGPSEEELELAKQNLTGRFPLSISSNGKKLGAITSIGFYNLPLDYLDNYVNNINNVTIEDITKSFNKHINLNKLAIVTVGGKAEPVKATESSNTKS